MALNLPTTEEVKDRNVSNLESSIGQDSPINDKAFLRVLGGMEAMNHTEQLKYAAERTKQSLALTATGEDLENIGAQFGVIRKQAVAAVLTGTLPGTNGTIIPASTDYIGDPNGIRYYQDSQKTISGGVATVSITAEDAGTDGNLLVGNTLTIATQISGAETTLTVTSIDTTGLDQEDQEVYRERVLFAERVSTGGGNAADYTIWAENVDGVRNAYVFSGKPFDLIATSYPGDRTVYIEADASINPDGIAPTSLLEDVRNALNTDPDTGESRPPIGLIDDTLFIESIVRTSFYIEIRQVDIPTDIETQVKADIETALETYLLSVRPFVDGVDISQNRNDKITTPSVNEVVQEILAINGSSAQSIAFGLAPSSFISQKTLDPNELGKLGGISYAS